MSGMMWVLVGGVGSMLLIAAAGWLTRTIKDMLEDEDFDWEEDD